MAKVYISEYCHQKLDVNGQYLPMGYEPSIATQVKTSSGTTGQSSAFNAKTQFIRIHTDGIISIAFGTNPTATTDSLRLPANAIEYFAVNSGDKVAIIDNT